MRKVLLALFVGALIADAAWCRLEIYRLQTENLAAAKVLTDLSNTNGHFESALLSCRYMVDGIRDTAERRMIERINTDIGMNRYMRDRNAPRDFTTVAKTLGDRDVVQARE